MDYDDLWWERSLRSVANVTRQDATEFLELVGAAGITTQFEELLPLTEAATALTRLSAGDVRGAFVLRPRSGSAAPRLEPRRRSRSCPRCRPPDPSGIVRPSPP